MILSFDLGKNSSGQNLTRMLEFYLQSGSDRHGDPVRVTFDALGAPRPSIIPVISCPVQWFVGIFEHPGFPILSRFLQNAEGVAGAEVQHLSKEIHLSYYTPSE
jgi:hypothetical protein